MPPDRHTTNRMSSLAALQRLKTMRDEQALALAGVKLARAETERENAHLAADHARSAVEKLQSSSEFSPDELRLGHALVNSHDRVAQEADAIVDDHRTVEQQSREAWHVSRHQHDVIRRDVRSAERYLSRKRDERVESDLRDQKANPRKDAR